MSSPPTEKDIHEAQSMVGSSAAPPVPQYHRKQDISTSMLCLSVLILMGGWALMWYMDVSCLGFDVRDFMPIRRSSHVRYGAGTRRTKAATTAATTPNSSARENEVRDVAAEAKKSVRDFFELAGNFHCPQSRRFTREEVARHRIEDDLWVVIDGNVLDLSTFINQHPGGLVLLDGAGGQDMATVFARFHHPSSVSLFSSFCIGRIADV